RRLWQSAQQARRGWRPFSQEYCQMLILTPPGIPSPGPSFVSSGPGPSCPHSVWPCSSPAFATVRWDRRRPGPPLPPSGHLGHRRGA
ncbi:ubiquitin specific peptidase 32, partial [Homo sapiens]